MGVRLKRIQYPSVAVRPCGGAALPSHVPILRLDGSETVSAWSTPPVSIFGPCSTVSPTTKLAGNEFTPLDLKETISQPYSHVS